MLSHGAQRTPCRGRKRTRTVRHWEPQKRFGQCLDICTYHCRSAASEADLRTLLHLAKKIRYDVVCPQETKTKASYARRMENGELLIMGQKIDAKNIGGVGFLIHPKTQPSILSHEILSPRIAVLRLRTEKKTPITILNCYAPNSVASEEDKDNFYSELEEVIRKGKSYYKKANTDGGPGKVRMDKPIQSWTTSSRIDDEV
ncbi:hypothetical protein ANCDUO_11910 [Ancylostoma duodenale]|uniref:Endonuclease/exonuclease/phosphatase domain-containing protein n=1 Tax=Ancylostoma duodenale TaxID=51022 RepID=A0A0C2GGF8_9BILA|nr:hypothetical protein ANCDUO_11910 [Ancylostoma duodenale]